MSTDILQYISPEILRQQNAEFMAKYPTDDAQIDYYTELAMQLWDEFQIDGAYDVRGTRVNVQKWYENKRQQMEMFRKHPYWCEEAKAIIFTFKETRKVNYYQAAVWTHRMRAYIHNHTHSCPTGDDILRYIQDTFSWMMDLEDSAKSTTITETFITKMNGSALPKGAQRMFKVGTKLSRFVRKCCEEFQMGDGSIINAMKFEDVHEPGDRDFDSAEKKFAKIADALSELTTIKVGLMSLNFLDFMTMSNGNSWSTCHYINSNGLFHRDDSTSSYHGAYKQGCLSYALDEPSFIFYTLPDKASDIAYYRQQKLTRMCCQYANGALVTGKCYPNNEDSLIKRYVNMLQNIISVTETYVDSWEFSEDMEDICDNVKTSVDAAHYADYTISRQHPTISLCRRLLKPDEVQMTIGHQAYCVYCGTKLRRQDGNWLQCSPHRKKMVCAHCGKKLSDDIPYHEYGNELLCGDCAFYCSVHGCVERIDRLYGTILMKDGEVQVCNDAMTMLAKCENCGTYGWKANMLKTEGGYSCKKHVRRYKKCNLCGVYVLNKEVHKHDDGSVYCSGCHEALQEIGGIRIVRKEMYAAGDYIVVASSDEMLRCRWYVNGIMLEFYPNKIVKITSVSTDYDYGRAEYRWSTLAGEDHSWCWGKECIAFAVVGVDDRFIGKTLAEARQIIKGE